MKKIGLPQSFESVDGRRLIIDRARQEEAQEIEDFLMAHFVPVPPIKQLCTLEDGRVAKPAWLRHCVDECLERPYSLVIRDKNGMIVAALLTVLEKKSLEPINYPSEWKLLVPYLTELNRDVDLFSIFGTDQIFHLELVAVSSEYARQGLAKFLYKLTLDLLAETGETVVVKTEAASSYIARLAAQLGFSVYNTISYASIEYNGSYPMAKDSAGLGDHQTCKLMARRLP